MRTHFSKSILLLFFALFASTSIYAQEQSNQQSFQEESLFYVGKIWGFVKYYHPEARLGKFDIDSSLVVLLDNVAPTKNLKERNAVLNEWVSQFGKIKEFEKLVIKDSSQYKLFYDYSWLENQTFDKKLSKQLIDIKNAKRTDSCYYVVLEYGYTPNFENEKPIKPDFSNSHQKLIPVLRYWNAIEYFYPYKYLTDKKWDDVLKEYIPIFLKTEDLYDFNTNTKFFTAEINDGHSSFKEGNRVYMEYPYWKYVLPTELIYSKDRFIVKGLFPYYKTTGNIRDYGLELGDEIVTINGRNPNEIMKNDYSKYWGASNFNYLCNSYYYSLLTSDTTFLDISYRRDGGVMNSRIKTGEYEYRNPVAIQKEKIEITDDKIAYLNLAEITPIEVYDILHKILITKGVILDMRGYPNYAMCASLASAMSPSRKRFVQFSGGTKKMPGMFELCNGKFEEDFIGSFNQIYYRGKVVILVNSSTMSSAEFSTMRFQQLSNVTTIGSTTAGADGDIAYIPLTDQISVGFSSVGIYYPDGEETQRVGVHIDEIVYPTPKGIKEGRDELVERAIEIIRAK